MYDFLLKTPFAKQWEKTGTEKRAGTIFPLFSIYSANSAGIGEIPDLKMAIDWCKEAGTSILQILPLNDTGFQPSPFSSQTSIGLNPLHTSLSSLIGTKSIKDEEKYLKAIFPAESGVNYRIAEEKIKVLKSIFNKGVLLPEEFQKFSEDNSAWLNDFSLFRSLKKSHGERSWKKWKKEYRDRDNKSLNTFSTNNKKEIMFWKWIQWQLFEQMKEVKRYAEKREILIKGDIPLFVSDDSADCWVDRKYFKLNMSTGTPPDNFSKKGQIWGMPPYDWENMAKDDFEFFNRRISYAENFYHLFRIDHVIGLFRTWSIKAESKFPEDGFFDPENQKDQIKRGEEILNFIAENSNMLPCAEDLGTIPDFCRKALKRFGIPGLDVGRWQKKYRKTAVSTLSTHDMDLFPVWLEKNGLSSELKDMKKSMEEVLFSPSIFSILMVFEWLFFTETVNPKEASKYRINRPGTKLESNWTARMPLSMEKLLSSEAASKVKILINDSGRNH